MRLSGSFFTFFSLFALRSTEEETPGICSIPRVVEKNRYAMDRSKGKWIKEIYTDTVHEEGCCRGYQAERQSPLSCVPICDPPCENSDCMGPNTCVCHTGHIMINNSNNSCYDVCDSCVQGACLSTDDLECTCFAGYSRNQRFQHICDPICSPQCVHAICIAPRSCKCNDGYKPHPDNSLSHICVPRCAQDCENGECYAPDVCKCHDGFELHPSNPYLCVPHQPQDSSLNPCILLMPQAVKYNKDLDCFLIKEKITLSVAPNCSVIGSQPGSFCSHLDNCHRQECVLIFQCSGKIINGSNEIHCNLEQGDSESDSADVNLIINTTEWTDVTLVVNSNKHINSSMEIRQNMSKEWTLQPSSKGPICGRKHFSVVMSECEAPNTPSQEKNHINSSFKLWMNVFLICGFLLMVGAGVGGFLWARHRKLNNPLNYREDMVQGYSNECYGTHTAELVSEDESDHYCDAPL